MFSYSKMFSVTLLAVASLSPLRAQSVEYSFGNDNITCSLGTNSAINKTNKSFLILSKRDPGFGTTLILENKIWKLGYGHVRHTGLILKSDNGKSLEFIGHPSGSTILISITGKWDQFEALLRNARSLTLMRNAKIIETFDVADASRFLVSFKECIANQKNTPDPTNPFREQ